MALVPPCQFLAEVFQLLVLLQLGHHRPQVTVVDTDARVGLTSYKSIQKKTTKHSKLIENTSKIKVSNQSVNDLNLIWNNHIDLWI